MADLFSVTAPLLIHYPDGTRQVVAELFPHPDGLLYFEIFWPEMPEGQGMHLVKGVLKGNGPWKVGDGVITVLGCRGSHPDQATEHAAWETYLAEWGAGYATRDEMLELAFDKYGDG